MSLLRRFTFCPSLLSSTLGVRFRRVLSVFVVVVVGPFLIVVKEVPLFVEFCIILLLLLFAAVVVVFVVEVNPDETAANGRKVLIGDVIVGIG